MIKRYSILFSLLFALSINAQDVSSQIKQAVVADLVKLLPSINSENKAEYGLLQEDKPEDLKVGAVFKIITLFQDDVPSQQWCTQVHMHGAQSPVQQYWRDYFLRRNSPSRRMLCPNS